MKNKLSKIESKEVNRTSPEVRQKSTMSVAEMARTLGIHKTDSYWLLHKSLFDTVTVNGHTRIVIESFEQWYANQTHYHKINRLPAGTSLMQHSYSVSDLAKMLAVTEATIYLLISRGVLETLPSDEHSIEQMRVSKDFFDRWYKSQSHYRNTEDRDADAIVLKSSISMPEIRHLLGLKNRNSVYNILNSPKYKDMFEYVTVGDQKRITKESFLLWYASQKHYSYHFSSIEAAQKNLKTVTSKNRKRNPQNATLPCSLESTNHSIDSDCYSVDDIAEILHLKHESVIRKLRKGEIPGKKVARSYWIPKAEFKEWFLYHEYTK